jgi:hypothetical protein
MLIGDCCSGEDLMSIYIQVVHLRMTLLGGGGELKSEAKQPKQDQTLKLDYPAMPNCNGSTVGSISSL